MSSLQILYAFSAALFILGIRGLGSPETARRGMQLAALGMLVAIVGTLASHEIVTYRWIIAGLVIGTLVSVPFALRIPMIAVPQRTALSHAGGALAACLIGIVEYLRQHAQIGSLGMGIIAVEVVLGALTFSGSLAVAGKLQGLLPGHPMTFRGQNVFNVVLFGVITGSCIYLSVYPESGILFGVLLVVGLLFGVLLVLPVGAADVPVIIALLNSYGGLTGAAMGFMLVNHIQIITGALDGASGFILSMLMCRAMNRSIPKVLFGAFGKQTETANSTDGSGKSGAHQPKTVSVEEGLQMFEGARSVIIVPGYGMAAAKAHHAIREFGDKLKAAGIKLKYAIHPVAGRMPGHMNVLLAEANVPYTDIFDMEQINSEFPHTDIALVVGANDVTNPAARNVKTSPIYGMPILDVDKAKKIIVCKRGTGPGFSGVENPLYLHDNTWLLPGDAKDSLSQMVWHFKHWGG